MARCVVRLDQIEHRGDRVAVALRTPSLVDLLCDQDRVGGLCLHHDERGEHRLGGIPSARIAHENRSRAADKSGSVPFGEPSSNRPPLSIVVSDGNVFDPAGVQAALELRALDMWERFLRLPRASNCGTEGMATLTWATSLGLLR